MKVSWIFVIAAILATVNVAAEDRVACVRVEVSSAGQSNDNAADRFSVQSVGDLKLTAVFKPDLAGDHILEIDVVTPDGYLYRSIAIPITSAEREPRVRSVPGYPRPMKEERLRSVVRGNSGFLLADVVLPVAGTDIVASGLYGRWSVQARLDGQRNPCAQASSFTLTE